MQIPILDSLAEWWYDRVKTKARNEARADRPTGMAELEEEEAAVQERAEAALVVAREHSAARTKHAASTESQIQEQRQRTDTILRRVEGAAREVVRRKTKARPA